MSKRKKLKYQAFIITLVTFVDFQILLLNSSTKGSGVQQCLREGVCPIRRGGGLSDGWKWACHRLMLLGALMFLVVWSTVSGIYFKPKILCPEDMFEAPTNYNTCRRPVYSSFGPKEKKHYCAATCCRPLCNIREKNIG